MGRGLSGPATRHRLLVVSPTTYDLPLSPSLAEKWDAISERVDLRIIGRRGRVETEDPRFRLVHAPSARLSGRAFHARLPWLVRQEIRRFRPDVVTTQSPFEALSVLMVRPTIRNPPGLLVDVHGDWRSAARDYGSRARRFVAPAADRAAAFALRRADGIRTVGPSTARLAREVTGRDPVAVFPAFFDLTGYASRPPVPLPDRPAVAWIGMLEAVKNVEGFAAAWRNVADRVPTAHLVILGRGRLQPLADGLAQEYPGRVEVITEFIPVEEVVDILDRSTLLALPSRTEGTPRVIMEAFARGRGVVASRVGGIPDLVAHGENGLLVSPGDDAELADALVRVLEDPALAAAMGRSAHRASLEEQWTAGRLADELDSAVTAVMARR